MDQVEESCGCLVPGSVQGQIRQGFVQPELVKDVSLGFVFLISSAVKVNQTKVVKKNIPKH